MLIAITGVTCVPRAHAADACASPELRALYDQVMGSRPTARIKKQNLQSAPVNPYEAYAGKRVALKYIASKRDPNTHLGLNDAEFVGVHDGTVHVRVEVKGVKVDRYIPEDMLLRNSLKVIDDLPVVKPALSNGIPSLASKLPMEQQKQIAQMKADHGRIKKWADEARAKSQNQKARYYDDQAARIEAQLNALYKKIKECAS